MELLEKYLQAVKFWLPSSQQNDIIAELRDDIRSEVEERENTLGRNLDEKELEALLKQRGRPLLVAEKYLPQRWLISPVLFPAYWFVLRLVLLCYFLPWIAVWIGLVTFSADYRAHHLGWAALGDAYFLISHALVSAAIVTIVFAILDHIKDKSWLTTDWGPRKLPPVRNTERIPRTKIAFELIFGTIFGIWWLKILWTLTVFETGGIKVTLPPEWHKFFWGFLLILIVNTPLLVYYLMRPYWTRRKRAMRVGSGLLSAVVLFFVAKDFAPVIAQGPTIMAGKVASLSWAITFGLAISFAIAAVVSLIVALVEAWRALRTHSVPPRLNQSVAI
jgi:hypothetical protein